MGKVYSPEALATGDYPQSVDAHAKAAEMAIAHLGELGGVVIGACVYGSVAMRFPSRRSDLDLLVTYDDTSTSAGGLLAIGEVLERVHSETHVVPEPKIVGLAEVRSGTYDFAHDFLYVDHLRRMALESPYRFGDAAEGMTAMSDLPEGQRLKTGVNTFARYIAAKREKIFEALNDGSGGLPLKTLQRVMELPSAYGRKLQEIEQIRDCGGVSDRNDAYRRQALHGRLFEIVDGHTDIVEAAGWLAGVDAAYTSLLEGVVAGPVGRRAIVDYRSWLDSMSRPALLQALSLTVGMQRYVHSELIV